MANSTLPGLRFTAAALVALSLLSCTTPDDRIREAALKAAVDRQQENCRAKGYATGSDAFVQCVNEIAKNARDAQERQAYMQYLASNPWSVRP